MDFEKVSISYSKPLQDIAGNLLEVKMIQSTYDPLAERLVAKMMERTRQEKDTIKCNSALKIPPSVCAVPYPSSATSITYDA